MLNHRASVDTSRLQNHCESFSKDSLFLVAIRRDPSLVAFLQSFIRRYAVGTYNYRKVPQTIKALGGNDFQNKDGLVPYRNTKI